ncbi:MAG: type II secretion system F family protein [Prochlorotrichaceae cyanobacterium]|jgi:type II secretory pathway component PulF
MIRQLLTTPRRQAEFFGQLGTLLDAGIPLSRALPLVSKGVMFWERSYWQRVSQSLDQGLDFTTALEQGGSPPLKRWDRTLLHTAERSGALAEMCRQLAHRAWADHRRDRYRRSVLQSLLSFLAGTIVGGTTLLRLPLEVSFLLLFLGLGAVTATLLSPQLETLRQQLPVVKRYDEIQFTLNLTELALPLRCGLSLLAALDLLCQHLPPGQLQETLHHAAAAVSRGLPLSQALGNQVPPLLRQYVRTGEESGSLEEMLAKVAEYYDQELESLLRRTQGTLKPLSLLGMGAIVLILGVGLIQQLLSQLPG